MLLEDEKRQTNVKKMMGKEEHMAENEQKTIIPSDKEMEVIRLMREVEYGKVVITVKNGEPVHAETQKSIILK